MNSPTMTSPPAPTAPGGPPPDEKKAAVGFAAVGFLAFGPLGLVVACLAVGIERAFLGSPWEQPGWLGGNGRPVLTPEQLEARRAEARRAAREWLDDFRDRQAERAADRKRAREEYNQWFTDGKTGDPPTPADRRALGEFMGDLYRVSKAWGKLFDERMEKGNHWINDKIYDPAGAFFSNLWNFLTDFVDGTRDEWDRQKKLREEQGKLDQDWAQPTGDQSQLDPAKDVPTGTDTTQPDTTQRPLTGEPGPVAPAIDAADPGRQRPAAPGPNPGLTPGTDRPAAPAGTDSKPPRGWLHDQPESTGEPALEGDVMTTDNETILPAGGGLVATGGPQGTTNLDLLLELIRPVPGQLGDINEQLLELIPTRAQITRRFARIAQLSTQIAPGVTLQLVDAGLQTIATLNQNMGHASMYVAESRELVNAAVEGLRPAAENQAETQGTGASGDIYDRPQG